MIDSAPIGELIEALIDYRGKTPAKTTSGVPLITAKVIKAGRIATSGLEYIAEADYDAWMRRGLPRSRDILVTTEAPLGEVAQIGTNTRVALAQRVILLRANPDKVDPQFLFHFLRSPLGQQRLRQRASGTTVSGIRQPELRAVEVSLLPRRSQEIVGAVLDAIDNLIANNLRRIELLQQMAQAIHREWLVYFRYPGYENATFVDSSLGPIPESWEVRALGDIASLDRTTVYPAKFPDEVFDHYSIPAFDDDRLPSVDEGQSIRSGKFLVREPAVLVSKLNPRIERTWFVQPAGTRRSVASTEFLVLRPRTEHLSLTWLYLTARGDPFQDRLRALSGGTSGSHQRAKPDAFMALDVVVPSEAIVGSITRACAPQLHLTSELRASNRNLVALRDLLLPRLVSGSVDVSKLDLDRCTSTR